MRVYFFFAMIISCHCVLPPGYDDDQLFCPADSCLQANRLPIRPGWTGRRSREFECCNTTNPAQASRPKGWGALIGGEYLQALVNHGYHKRECEPMSSCSKHLKKNAPVSLLHASLQTLQARVHAVFEML